VTTHDEISRVQAKYIDMLMSKPNVIGVALGNVRENGVMLDEKGLIVLVQQKLPEQQIPPKDRIPHELDGVRVDVQPFGSLTAH